MQGNNDKPNDKTPQKQMEGMIFNPKKESKFNQIILMIVSNTIEKKNKGELNIHVGNHISNSINNKLRTLYNNDEQEKEEGQD